MKYKIVFSQHFNETRKEKKGLAKKRRPLWFDFKTACFLTYTVQNKIQKMDDDRCCTIRIEINDIFQYFLVKKKINQQENAMEIVFMSALEIPIKKSFLPYRNVDSKCRFDIDGNWSVEKLLSASKQETIINFIKAQETKFNPQNLGYDIKMFLTVENIKKYLDNFDYSFFAEYQSLNSKRLKRVMYKLYETIGKLEYSLKLQKKSWIKGNLECLNTQIALFNGYRRALNLFIVGYHNKNKKILGKI